MSNKLGSSTGMSGQVNSMRSMDVRRLWEKLHNSDFRDNCFAYYREATFEKEDPAKHSSYTRRTRAGPNSRQQNMNFFRRLSVNSTEKKVVLVLAGVLGLGIGVTRMLAYSSQTNSVQRVESYVDDLRTDWNKYQESVRKS